VRVLQVIVVGVGHGRFLWHGSYRLLLWGVVMAAFCGMGPTGYCWSHFVAWVLQVIVGWVGYGDCGGWLW
jgi:hypothetical protein